MAGVPASSHGGGLPLTGGTLTGPLVVDYETADVPVLTVKGIANAHDLIDVTTASGDAPFYVQEGKASAECLSVGSGATDRGITDRVLRVYAHAASTARILDVETYNGFDILVADQTNNNTGRLGFFGVGPALQPSLTSATATPEQIALALQSLGIAGGT